jgi:hypothetical protein
MRIGPDVSELQLPIHSTIGTNTVLQILIRGKTIARALGRVRKQSLHLASFTLSFMGPAGPTSSTCARISAT